MDNIIIKQRHAVLLKVHGERMRAGRDGEVLKDGSVVGVACADNVLIWPGRVASSGRPIKSER